MTIRRTPPGEAPARRPESTRPGSANAGSAHAPLTRRERTRAATIDEIKATATRLMREQGSADPRFSDIAREMGMTAPALYRYFADRDELLTALIVDAYDELGGVVAEARESIPAEDAWGRFYAIAHAYREWARREPVRFTLILGLPVPGYAAPEEGPTTEAAKRAMSQLKALFFDAAARDELSAPMLGEVDAVIHECCTVENAAHPDDPPTTPEMFQAMLRCWASLHGFASLEAHGHLDWLPEQARDSIFDSNVRLAAAASGLPVPQFGQPDA